MVRGILSGMVWGLLIAIVAVVMISLVGSETAQIARKTPEAEAPGAAAESDTGQAAPAAVEGEGQAPSEPQAEPETAAAPAPQAEPAPAPTPEPTPEPETAPEPAVEPSPEPQAEPEPGPAETQPPQPAPATMPEATMDAPSIETGHAVAPAVDSAPTLPASPAENVLAPQPPTDGVPSVSEPAPANIASAQTPEAALTTPEIEADAPAVQAGEGSDTALTGGKSGTAPAAPMSETPPVVDVPAPVPAPGAPVQEPQPPAAETAIAALPAPESPAPAAAAPPVPQAAPADATPDAGTEPPAPPAAQPEAAEAQPEPETELAAEPDVAPEAEPEVAAAEPTPSEAEASEPASEPQIRVGVGEMRDLAPNVTTDRLPSIGGEVSSESPGASTQAEEPAPQEQQNALYAYAADFENPDDKPLFSVILVDDPATPLDDAVLADLPVPVSFAIDATRDDAGAAAQRYRDAGFEVVMLTNLPKGATPTDVEIALQGYYRALPSAVALLDSGANGFQSSRALVTQVVDALSESGHGLVTFSKGLNAAQQIASRQGLPAATIFRDLDSNDERAAQIRRYLDRAAFRAGQEGYVIMLGRARPETIEGLVLWALEDRAASVALAPVSAVLKAQ